MRLWGWTVCLAVAACMFGPSWAQDSSGEAAGQPVTGGASAPQLATQTQNIVNQVPVIAFDRDRIFAVSNIGLELEARIEKLLSDLVAENDAIFAALEAEEKELTTLKDTLSSEAFSLKADAFDSKVIAIRAEQKSKSEAIQQTKDQGIREFEKALNVVLTEIAQEVRAVAVFERGQIYLMSGSIDISLEVIKRLNASGVTLEAGQGDMTDQSAPQPSTDQ